MADKPGTPIVSARALREAAARAGGFDKLTMNIVDQVSSGEPMRSKYRNVRTVVDGETFDSKHEAQCWHELKLRERAGEIHGLKRQVSYDLFCPSVDGFDAVAVVSHYIADFVYADGAGTHVVDAKGKRTAMYQLKKKWLELQSGIIIEEI